MYCKYCGKEIEENNLYCPFCGKKQTADQPADKTQLVSGKSNTLRYMILIAAALIAIGAGIVIIVTGGSGGGETAGVPDGAVEYAGHRYKICNDPMSWTEAESKCEADGGHLVTINSAEEQAFIREQLEKDGLQKHHYWLGGTDRDNEGEWRWVTGEPFTYTNWDPGDGKDHEPQPNNASDQDYIELQTINNTGSNYMTWNDMCDSGDNGENQGAPWFYMQPFFGYICEWDQ